MSKDLIDERITEELALYLIERDTKDFPSVIKETMIHSFPGSYMREARLLLRRIQDKIDKIPNTPTVLTKREKRVEKQFDNMEAALKRRGIKC